MPLGTMVTSSKSISSATSFLPFFFFSFVSKATARLVACSIAAIRCSSRGELSSRLAFSRLAILSSRRALISLSLSLASLSRLAISSRASSRTRFIVSSLAASSNQITIYWAKYSTRSRFRGEMSKRRPTRLGVPFTNQMWLTGAASSMWPILSRRTLERAISTPHLSQTIPRYLIFLYLPQ